MVTLVTGLHQFLELTIGLSVRFCLTHHFRDLFFIQTRRGFDGDFLFAVGVLIFCRDMQNTIGIDIEGDFNLRHTARSRVDAIEVELTQRFVIRRTFTLTLQHMDGYRRLVVFRSREHLAVLGRDGGVFVDQRSHYAAHGFDTQRQRGNVQQQNVFHFTRQNTALNRSTDSNSFVRVHVFTRLFTEEFGNFFLHHRHTCLTTDQNHVVNVGNRQTSILQCNFQRLDGTVYQVFHQAFQFRTSHFDVHVFRTGCICSDIRQVHIGLLCRRELDFRFFCSFFQTLHRQWIVTQIDTLIFLKLFHQVVNQTAVEVFTTQVGITVGCQNFEGFFTVNIIDFDDRDIERTATQVVYRNGTVTGFFIQTVSQCRRGRFVNDTFDFQACDTAGVFGRLTLRIVKVSRNGDNSFSYRLTQVIFRGFLHFFQDFRRNLRRRHFGAFYVKPCVAVVGSNDFVRHDGFITLNFFVLEATANQAFDRKQGVLRVRHCLTFSRLTHQSFAILCVGNDRRCGAVALCVLQHTCLSAIHNRYTRVGSTQVDTNNFTHLNVSTKNSVNMWL
ncbi:glutamate dehydrogenase [Enterobacter sp. FY-07]|nr:glutamate dehydrogenase [Enterobacter sp. FY-07]